MFVCIILHNNAWPTTFNPTNAAHAFGLIVDFITILISFFFRFVLTPHHIPSTCFETAIQRHLHTHPLTLTCSSANPSVTQHPFLLANVCVVCVPVCVCFIVVVAIHTHTHSGRTAHACRFYQKYQELRARIKANSCPGLPASAIGGGTGTGMTGSCGVINSVGTAAGAVGAVPGSTATAMGGGLGQSYLVQRSASLKDHRQLRYGI